MKNKKIEIILQLLLALIISIFSLSHTMSPVMLYPEEFLPWEDAGWKLNSDRHNYHMGDKVTKYGYHDDLAKSYRAYVDGGIALWGEHIDMREEEDDIMGDIIVENNPAAGYMAKVPDQGEEDCHNPCPHNCQHLGEEGHDNCYHDYHETGWILIINRAKFDPISGDTNKEKVIAHEIGHIYGLAHVDNIGQIMYEYYWPPWSITSKDEWGMKICTDQHTEHEFTEFYHGESGFCIRICEDCRGCIKAPNEFTSDMVTIGTDEICQKEVYTCSVCGYSYDGEIDDVHEFTSEWVPIGTEDICQNEIITCSICGYSYEVLDITHEWTDESDTECNDCGYDRLGPFEIVELEGLLTITINGQVWVLNYSEAGTSHEWSTNPPRFSELHGYSSVYTMRSRRLLWWSNVGGLFGGVDNRYCYTYDTINYYHGRYWWYKPDSFHNLRLMTEIKDNDGNYNYLRGIESLWYPQYYSTTRELKGIFWAQLCGNAESGYYVVINRGLADEDVDDSIVIKGGSVWKHPIHYPVYFVP